MPNSKEVLTGQQKIAKLAKEAPDMSFLSLNQYLTMEWLREAYRRTRKDGATGVDQQTAAEYEQNLESNLENLLGRAKSGTYFAPPVRRVHIPKDKPGETRALGIPTFEDKVLQRAVCMILEPIYEQDFMDCSYGFRPNRSAHDCLRAMREKLDWGQGSYVIDVDIRQYFDSIDKSQLREILRNRVRDGVITRLIGKWLKAGVMEDKRVCYPDAGTPQGGVISPLLANIYLHHVLDDWFYREVQPRMHSNTALYRFADDLIIICKAAGDAGRIKEVLPKRFNRFGLQLNMEKTKQVDFTRPGKMKSKGETFDFLGFTLYWGKTRKGEKVVKLKTRKARQSRAHGKINILCREIRHWSLREQHKRINRTLIGMYNYYGVSFNFDQVKRLRYAAARSWHYWLNRRSQQRHMPWIRFQDILKTFPLAVPRIRMRLY